MATSLKKELFKGRDREEVIIVARRHAGEFDKVEVWAMGEYEEGFDEREPVISISRPQSPAS